MAYDLERSGSERADVEQISGEHPPRSYTAHLQSSVTDAALLIPVGISNADRYHIPLWLTGTPTR